MPQITLECSDNVLEKDFQSLLLQIHQFLTEKLPTELNNCKSRVLRHSNYLIGDGNANQAFVHLSINILPGRSKELQQSVGDALMKLLIEAFHQSRKKQELQISIAIQDLPGVYLKG